jgi:importin subunit beta-1
LAYVILFELTIIQLTVLGMKHENEKVALQAIEFWSTVCDEEIEIQAENEEWMDGDDENPRKSHQFALKAVGELVPVLLWLLTKREEDDDEDEWNLPMAAATCLSLLANCVGDLIVQPVIPFVEQNIQSPDWRFREAAVMVFGSILEGPKPELLQPLVQQALPILLELIRDPVLSVKDTAAWTLGRISDLLVSALQPEGNLQAIITAVVNGLSDSPRVAANCCWVRLCVKRLTKVFDEFVGAIGQR